MSTNTHENLGLKADGAAARTVLKLMRDEMPTIVDRWTAEVSRVPFSKVTDFVGAPKVRSERLRAYLHALIDRIEEPESRKALEILRSTIRSEHVRALDMSRLISNQLILRRIMVDFVEEMLSEDEVPGARKFACHAVDRGVEEMATMMEEHIQMESVLVKCLSCSPGDRSELEQSFARFCRNAMDYFDSDFVAVFQYLPQTKELMCVGCSAKGVAISKDSRIFLSSFPLAAEALQNRASTTCVSSSWSPGPKKKMLGQMSFDHCILVPLVRGDVPIGLFFIGDTSGPTPFTPDEVSLAEDFGANLVRVMENVELFEKLSIRSRAQTALIETAANLQKEIESSEMYRIIADKMTELIPCNELAFYMFDWSRRVGNPVYANGPYAAEVMEDRDFPADQGYVGHVARTKKAEIILDTEEDNRGAYIPGTPATHSRMLAVPIMGKMDVLGVIEMLKYPPDVFTNEDLEVATMLANHAAVAIENARLLKEVSTTRDQVELHMDLLTHDIANYVTPVMAYLESLKDKPGLEPEVLKVIDRTLSQVYNVMQLVDIVRTMARLREEPFSRLVRTDMRPVLEAAVSEAKARSLGRTVVVALDLPHGPMHVMADPILKEAFRNLFMTASRSQSGLESRFTVTVERSRDGRRDMWWVRVSQPDRSIPDHLKDLVLRMAKGSKSELTGGFGIGLAAAKNVVEAYSGRMWVSDIVPKDPSKGCVFNITLPVAE